MRAALFARLCAEPGARGGRAPTKHGNVARTAVQTLLNGIKRGRRKRVFAACGVGLDGKASRSFSLEDYVRILLLLDALGIFPPTPPKANLRFKWESERLQAAAGAEHVFQPLTATVVEQGASHVHVTW